MCLEASNEKSSEKATLVSRLEVSAVNMFTGHLLG
jgi:hypothetical protein